MKKKGDRIALVLGARHNFWTDQRVKRSATALDANGYEILSYSPACTKKDEYPMEGVAGRYVTAHLAQNAIAQRFLLDYLMYNVPLAFNVKREHADICHCNDFDTLPCGMLLKIMTLGRIKVVYDSHEHYPNLVAEGHGKWLATLIGIIETILCKFFVDGAVTVTESLRKRFEKMGTYTETVFNCQELHNLQKVNADEIYKKRPNEFIVVYQGKIFKKRGYEQLVEVADILVNTKGLKQIKFIVIGASIPDQTYIESIKNSVTNRGLDQYFVFTGFLPYERMMQIVSSADTGIILLEPTPNNLGALPNKLFENLAAGIPTITSDFPDMAKIIREENCGLLVDVTKANEIADSIEYLLNNREIRLEMGRNALRAAQEKYNFAKQSEKLLALYRKIS